ncbi:MAG TPA: FecR domain-containing protein [Pedobacter sp.]
MNIPEFEELLGRYLEGKCTVEEVDLLRHWYYSYEMKDLPELTGEQLMEIVAMHPEISSAGKTVSYRLWWSVAAALFFVVSAGLYFVSRREQGTRFTQYHAPILPGGNRAVLTLAGGKKIILTNAGNGQLANQGSVRISKTADGVVQYAFTGEPDHSAENNINLISTPAGGQYHLILADGSQVWLNSSSSIKFPASFSTNERRIGISGEAYFEVSHDARRPFRVVCDGQTTEVLGTHFNINGYQDNGSIVTTLLEGKVRITKDHREVLLSPGEQARVTPDHTITVTEHADAELAVAWKNGLFKFNKTDLKEVMQQLGRWYDVDVRYNGQIRDRKFSGEITRGANISEVLDMLSLLKINFKISETGQRKVITVITN